VARECEVMSVLSGRPSTSDDAMQLAHVGLRRSLHGDETFDIKQLNKTSLLASLRAVQLSNAADDVAAHECRASWCSAARRASRRSSSS